MIQPLSPQQLPMRQVPSSEKDVAENRVEQGQGGARRADLIDRMVKGRADRVVRARTREILSALPEGTLRALARDGLTIEVTGAELPKGQKGPVRMGAYFPASKTISVGRWRATQRARSAHPPARGHARQSTTCGPRGGQAESHGNERLAEAYGDFRARAAVQDALRVEAMLQKKNIPLDGHRSVHNDGWGERGLRIQRHADFDRVTFDEQPHWMRGKVAAMAAGGAMAVAASALAIPVLGTVGVVVGAVSALALGVNALFRSLPITPTSARCRPPRARPPRCARTAP